MTDTSPQLTVPLDAVLDEYIRMNTELTMSLAQMRVLLAERSRELAAGREEAEEMRAKLAAADAAPAWPYETPPGGVPA
ncbi:hypothetical protein [Kitasatospora sp. NPDC057223]|uniref:hypothetical protein n=1 Tax=Kitasatospora sp. NPDC057223 TaxID=3346055 RepID=UPI003638EAF3